MACSLSAHLHFCLELFAITIKNSNPRVVKNALTEGEGRERVAMGSDKIRLRPLWLSTVSSTRTRTKKRKGREKNKTSVGRLNGNA